MGKSQETYPEKRTIKELFEEQVKRTPEKTAVKEQNRFLTYEELNEWANAIAWKLKEEGVGRGDVAAVAAPRSIEAVAGMLGVLKAGAAYVPVDTEQGEERTRYIQKDSQAAILLFHGMEVAGEKKSLPIGEFQKTDKGNPETEGTGKDLM
ncbi:AMP-binding protein, partial [Anaeromicropila populeti]